MDTERGAVRLVEVLGVLSLATDIAMGHPWSTACAPAYWPSVWPPHLQLDAAEPKVDVVPVHRFNW